MDRSTKGRTTMGCVQTATSLQVFSVAGSERRPRGRFARPLRGLVALAVLGCTVLAAGSASAYGVFTVNGTADGTAKDGILTLREALLLANGGTGPSGLGRPLSLGEKAQTYGCTFIGGGNDWSIFDGCGVGVRDRIEFGLQACPCLLLPTAALPPTTEPLVIDGFSQKGSAANTADVGSNAVYGIVLDGLNAGAGANGLTVTGGNTFIEGLAIVGFGGDGIALTTNGDDVLSGNLITLSGGDGVSVGSPANEIGLDYVAGRNVINLNGANGVRIGVGMVANRIANNLIGTGADGAGDAGNALAGVSVGGTNNLLANNVIAHNIGDGIAVVDGAQYVHVTRNSSFANGGLAIDLGDDGVTANDNLQRDQDTGDNGRQNFPVVQRANHATKTIRGKLVSTPNAQFRIEVFASPSCDPVKHGEAKVFLGSKVVATSPKGVVRFAIKVPTEFAAGDAITATATTQNDATSELSRCRTAK
jgi:hypothetical protein